MLDICDELSVEQMQTILKDLKTSVGNDGDALALFAGNSTEHYVAVTVEFFSHLKKVIGASYGPTGANTYITRGENKITKDGISILFQQHYRTEVFQKFLELAIEQSKTALKKSGDGTTTAMIVLASALEECLKSDSYKEIKGDSSNLQNILAAISSIFNKKIDEYVKHVESVQNLRDIAAVSLNYNTKAIELMEMLFTYVDANQLDFKNVIYQVGSSSKNESYIDMEYGISTYSVPVGRGELMANETQDDDALVLTLAQNLSNHHDIAIVTELIKRWEMVYDANLRTGKETVPFYVVASKIDTAVSMVLNTLYRDMFSRNKDVPIYFYELTALYDDKVTDNFTDFLTYFNQTQVHTIDLCDGVDPTKPIGTDNEPAGINIQKFQNVARSATVIKSRRKTTFIPREIDKSKVDALIKELEEKLTYAENKVDIASLNNRLNYLRGSKCLVLRVYDEVLTEASRLLDQLDDAVSAVNSAVTNGFVIGANMTSYRAISNIESGEVINEILTKAGKTEAAEIVIDQILIDDILEAFKNAIVKTMMCLYKGRDFSESLDKMESEVSYWADYEDGKVLDMRTQEMSNCVINPVDTDKAIFGACTTIVGLIIGTNQITFEEVTDASVYIQSADFYYNRMDRKLKALMEPAEKKTTYTDVTPMPEKKKLLRTMWEEIKSWF